MNDDYGKPLSLTSQFRFCGNPFRLDFYKFCSFGCKYCFARNINGNADFSMSYAKFEIVENYFKKAFDTNEPSRDVVIELLRHKVPIHVGGLADPFQPIEWRLKLNYKLIELSNKYHYPLIFSTKQCYLPEEYWNILNPELHAFQISLIGVSDEYIRKYEDNSPLASERVRFLKELRGKGFWCSIRIQPVIDINEVLNLCDIIDGIASYVTVEHIKINIENPTAIELFQDILYKCKSKSKMRDLEIPIMEKIANIKRIKEHLPHTIVGVGDNDLHYLSESRCCCGVDTINDNFKNYMKYNLTYFTTENQSQEKEDYELLWTPKCSVRNCINGDIRVKGLHDFKEYVLIYCSKNNEFMCQGCSMKNKTDGIMYNKDSGKKFKQVTLFNMQNNDKSID